MYQIDARLSDTRGNGVGRWRKYYEAEDLPEAVWVSRHLVPKAQVRIRHRKAIVVQPCLAEQLPEVVAAIA